MPKPAPKAPGKPAVQPQPAPAVKKPEEVKPQPVATPSVEKKAPVQAENVNLSAAPVENKVIRNEQKPATERPAAQFDDRRNDRRK